MGKWENTTYLKHGDASLVAAAIVELFAEEGMVQVERPSQRATFAHEPMQYGTALENNRWGVAVFPGAPGWTIVKTAPLELLGERAPTARRMRLVELTDRLKCGAFQINLYDSSSGLILIEADGCGRYLLSGNGYGGRRQNPDPLIFFGEQLAEDRVDVRFELLPLQTHVEAHTLDWYLGHRLIDNDAFTDDLAKTLGGDSASWCDNDTAVDVLVCHKPLPMACGIERFFDWPPGDRPEELLRTELEQVTAHIAARRAKTEL
jgi:hypothetical protein